MRGKPPLKIWAILNCERAEVCRRKSIICSSILAVAANVGRARIFALRATDCFWIVAVPFCRLGR